MGGDGTAFDLPEVALQREVAFPSHALGFSIINHKEIHLDSSPICKADIKRNTLIQQ
jgi:hypothetical protein